MAHTDPHLRREFNRRYARQARQDVIAMLGGRCSRCSFADWRALQVDHVEGDGHLDRSMNDTHPVSLRKRVRESAPGTFQLLCANCNWIKRYELKEHTRRDPDSRAAALARA